MKFAITLMPILGSISRSPNIIKGNTATKKMLIIRHKSGVFRNSSAQSISFGADNTLYRRRFIYCGFSCNVVIIDI